MAVSREPCDTDDGGLRRCCSTRQLGPHAETCPRPAGLQDGMADHEHMFSHQAELGPSCPWCEIPLVQTQIAGMFAHPEPLCEPASRMRHML